MAIDFSFVSVIFNIVCIALILYILFKLIFRKRQSRKSHSQINSWHPVHVSGNMRKALSSGKMIRKSHYVYQKAGRRFLRVRV